MKRCGECGQKRDDSEFFRTIKSPIGEVVKLPTRDCIRCISDAARTFHVKRKARAK